MQGCGCARWSGYKRLYCNFLHYASRSYRHLHVGMLVAGDLQGFVVNNHKLCAQHETAFLSFLFPNHGVHMSFAAWGNKMHMVFTPLHLPYSEMVMNGEWCALESPDKWCL